MQLHLQFGYGMMEHCKALLKEWGGGTAILSPRDLTPEQLSRLSLSLLKIDGGRVMLDPQLYLPHADHERLCGHDFWPDQYETETFFSSPKLAELITKLYALNVELGSTAFILPGLLAVHVNDDWLNTQRLILEEAQASTRSLPLIQTIALSEGALLGRDTVGAILDNARGSDVKGHYLVLEHPGGKYLVDNPIWLANALDLIAGLKLAGSKVVVGYCNHQMLIAACAKADAIASGTWMNVRSFPPEKFRSQLEDEIRQRATCYYCPQSFSEYKLPFLEIAQRFDILDSMKPTGMAILPEIGALFSGDQPTTVGLTEQTSFRHYLSALRHQAEQSSLPSFDATVKLYTDALDRASLLLADLDSKQVRGQQRDFGEIIDVNRAALAILVSDRGSLLRRKWATM